MKFFLPKTSFLLCALAAMAIAMPVYFVDEDVEVRSDLAFDGEVAARDDFGASLDARAGYRPRTRMGMAGGLGGAGASIANLIADAKETIEADKDKRSKFTSDLVKKKNAENPKLNYVVCTRGKTAFDGKKGKDWGHSHQDLPVNFPINGKIGYEIYWFKSGKFTREGDGGYLNWAYIGNVKSKSKDGREIVFGPR